MDIDCSAPSPIRVISKLNPTSNLKYHIKQYAHTRIDISVKSLDFYSLELYGIYQKFKVSLDKFRVKILLNNRKGNSCWERYIVSKELSHILTGEDKVTWTKDVVELISKLVNGVAILKSSNKEVLQTEYTTPIIAMELLVPYCYNYLLEDQTKTSLEIATILKVPESIIDILRRDDYQTKRKETYTNLS
jgi:Zn-dependent peptidase ImmA (M78 family)